MSDYNYQGVSPQSFIAGGTIGANRLVKADSTAGQAVVTSAITDAAIGVALIGGDAGALIPVQQFGKAKIVASDAIVVGAQVMPTASGSGKCVTAAGGSAKSIGIALTAAGADGDIIEVQLGVPAINGPANS